MIKLGWGLAKSELDPTRPIAIPIDSAFKFFCDNKLTVLCSNNNINSTKSKDIDIEFLVVKERAHSGQLSVEHVDINSMIANLLTKGMPSKIFYEHTGCMDIVSL